MAVHNFAVGTAIVCINEIKYIFACHSPARAFRMLLECPYVLFRQLVNSVMLVVLNNYHMSPSLYM